MEPDVECLDTMPSATIANGVNPHEQKPMIECASESLDSGTMFVEWAVIEKGAVQPRLELRAPTVPLYFDMCVSIIDNTHDPSTWPAPLRPTCGTASAATATHVLVSGLGHDRQPPRTPAPPWVAPVGTARFLGDDAEFTAGMTPLAGEAAKSSGLDSGITLTRVDTMVVWREAAAAMFPALLPPTHDRAGGVSTGMTPPPPDVEANADHPETQAAQDGAVGDTFFLMASITPNDEITWNLPTCSTKSFLSSFLPSSLLAVFLACVYGHNRPRTLQSARTVDGKAAKAARLFGTAVAVATTSEKASSGDSASTISSGGSNGRPSNKYHDSRVDKRLLWFVTMFVTLPRLFALPLCPAGKYVQSGALTALSVFVDKSDRTAFLCPVLRVTWLWMKLRYSTPWG